MAKSYKGILFDAGDTLVKLSRPFPEIMESMLAQEGLTVHPDRLRSALQEVFLEIEEARANPQGETQTSDEVAKAYWTSIYLEVGKRAGVAGLSERHADRVYDYMFRELPFTTVPGAVQLLEWCRAQGYRVGLVSNWGTDLREVLRRLDLERHFDVTVISAEVGLEKPDVRIFLHALKDMGVKAQEALYVGDDYNNDGVGSWAAGMDPLLVDLYDRYAPGVFPRVQRLEQVRHYIERGGEAE